MSSCPSVTTFRQTYGPWAVVLGASDGTGEAFARALDTRGVNVVLVARREPLLARIAADLAVETRTVATDLTDPGAVSGISDATGDLDVGLVIYNAGADPNSAALVDQPLDAQLAMVQRNCAAVLETSHRFGRRLLDRGRGGLVLVTSGTAWAGGATLATYGATKAFDLLLAESLWAEWRPAGVDALALVLGATDTPSLSRRIEEHGGEFGELADPAEVADEVLEHLGDGPTWSYGMPDPEGGSPFGSMRRRDAVELMSTVATSARRAAD